MIKGLIITPIIGSIIMLGSLRRERIGIIISILEMYITLWIVIKNNNNIIEVQHREYIKIGDWIIRLGLDGFSTTLIMMIVSIIPIVFMVNQAQANSKVYNDDLRSSLSSPEISRGFPEIWKINVMQIESIIIYILSTMDIIQFYIGFELILIPLFIIIGREGKRKRRIEASYRIMIYTLMGSFIMIIGIIIIIIKYGTTNNELMKIILSQEEDERIKKVILGLILVTLMIKVPMMPFHTWLPEAHAEAPTIGSVILAGIILKIGTYGIIRYGFDVIGLRINKEISPLIITVGIIGVIYGSISTIRQIDIKKMIAYSSIVHMNALVIGLYSFTNEGIIGSIYMMISHGYVTSSWFILIGYLYNRYQTRIITYYRGICNYMPIYGLIYIYITWSNMGVPLTSGFIGEQLITIGSFKRNKIVGILLALGLIISAAYSIWLANRIIYGQSSLFINKWRELSLKEFYILLPFIIFTLVIAIKGNIIVDFILLDLSKLI